MARYAPPETFKHRADFLRMARRGKKIPRPGFLMQALTGGQTHLQVGYTASKKLGNAVARNRARRRLREAARLTLAGAELRGVELVLVCRRETATLPFETLCQNIRTALDEALR